jgi:hypothetical protein
MLVVDQGGAAPELVGLARDGSRTPLGQLGSVCTDPLALATSELGELFVLDRGGERVVRRRALQGDVEVVVDLAEHDFDAPGAAD